MNKNIKNEILIKLIKEIKYKWNLTGDLEQFIELNSKLYFKVFRLLERLCVFLVMSEISKHFHMLIKYYIVTIILIFSLLRMYIAIDFIW